MKSPRESDSRRGVRLDIAWLVAALMASAALISFSFGYPVSDDAFFELVGRQMLHGTHLYTGIWDNKPPAIYLTDELLQFLFGGRYVLHRIAEYLVTLVAIGLFSMIVRHSYPDGCGPATFAYAILVSLPTMAFLNYAPQYAMLPMLLAVLFAMQGRPIVAALAHIFAIAFWPPTLLTSIAVVLWLGDRRRSIVYLVTLVGGAVVAIAIAIAAFSPVAIHDLLHDMGTYQEMRTQAGGPIVAEIRSRLAGSLLLTAFAYPLLAFVALLRRPTKRDEVVALVWFCTAMAGALTNLNFSWHYFYPAVAPTIYAIFLFAERTVWSRARIVTSIAVAVVVLALLPRTLNLSRQFVKGRQAESASGKIVGDAVAAYLGPSDEILVWGYYPEVYLEAGADSTGRYANYLALRPDTAALSDRMIRIHEYANDVARAAAVVRMNQEVVPPEIRTAIATQMLPVCTGTTRRVTLYVSVHLIDHSKRCTLSAGPDRAAPFHRFAADAITRRPTS